MFCNTNTFSNLKMFTLQFDKDIRILLNSLESALSQNRLSNSNDIFTKHGSNIIVWNLENLREHSTPWTIRMAQLSLITKYCKPIMKQICCTSNSESYCTPAGSEAEQETFYLSTTWVRLVFPFWCQEGGVSREWDAACRMPTVI